MQVAIWSHIAVISIETEPEAEIHIHPLHGTHKHFFLKTINRSSERIPEIRILDIGQIVKRMRIGIEYSPIRLSLGGDLSIVPPDQEDPGSQDDSDKARVKAQVDIERVDISRCPWFPEQLGCYGITACPAHDCLSALFRRERFMTYRSERK